LDVTDISAEGGIFSNEPELTFTADMKGFAIWLVTSPVWLPAAAFRGARDGLRARANGRTATPRKPR
jgi:hypothetical protein